MFLQCLIELVSCKNFVCLIVPKSASVNRNLRKKSKQKNEEIFGRWQISNERFMKDK